jgi:hypothetical protein
MVDALGREGEFLWTSEALDNEDDSEEESQDDSKDSSDRDGDIE